MVFSFSLMTVAVRRYQQTSMVAAAAMSNILGCLVSLPFAHGILSVTAHDIGIFAMFGGLQVALGLTLYVLGSRYLPSGEASLIATLETPLMVFWVWVGFQEVPAVHALIGGALVVGAVVVDIVGDNRERARRNAASFPVFTFVHNRLMTAASPVVRGDDEQLLLGRLVRIDVLVVEDSFGRSASGSPDCRWHRTGSRSSSPRPPAGADS